jgi:hypothetical protein
MSILNESGQSQKLTNPLYFTYRSDPNGLRTNLAKKIVVLRPLASEARSSLFAKGGSILPHEYTRAGERRPSASTWPHEERRPPLGSNGRILYSARGRALAGSACERSDMGCGPLALDPSVFVIPSGFFLLVHWFGSFFLVFHVLNNFEFEQIQNLNNFRNLHIFWI